VRRNRLENDEVHIIDVGSLNGTYVNRQASESAVLVNGDEVQIGKFRVSSTTLDVLRPTDRATVVLGRGQKRQARLAVGRRKTTMRPSRFRSPPTNARTRVRGRHWRRRRAESGGWITLRCWASRGSWLVHFGHL
jgi:pSer/pThr/pTyr-binding forkhead associated (FHA) protein